MKLSPKTFLVALEIPPAPFFKGGAAGRGSNGFTLMEVIVTIVAAGILGVIFMNFMGTAMSRSVRSVLNVEAEANAQALMELIVSDYAVEINKADPSGALETIRTRSFPVGNYPGAAIQGRRYVTLNNTTGDLTVLPESTTSGDTLRVVVVWNIPEVPETGGTAITTLLTRTRRNAEDPAVAF
jgi:prepilin-type N-terminal cleavage/methylation domain-containing protein